MSIFFKRVLFTCIHAADLRLFGTAGGFGLSKIFGVQNQTLIDRPEPWPQSRVMVSPQRAIERHELARVTILAGIQQKSVIVVDTSGREPPTTLGWGFSAESSDVPQPR